MLLSDDGIFGADASRRPNPLGERQLNDGSDDMAPSAPKPARQPSPAQNALNAFGRQEPPRRSALMFDDDDAGPPEIDYDRLDEEEMEIQREQQPPDDFDEDEESAMLEAERGSAVTAGSAKDSSAKQSTSEMLSARGIGVARPSAYSILGRFADEEDEQMEAEQVGAEAGPSRLQEAATTAPQEQDPFVGMHGLNKFFDAGLMTATTFDGKTVTLGRRKRLRNWRPLPPHFGAGPTGLLSKPVHRIIEAVEAAKAEAIVDRSERESEALRKAGQPLRADHVVWSEKYRPQRFTELLGEERTHREVLSWVKEWDPCVFKRKPKKKKEDDAASSGWKPQSSFGQNVAPDPWHRPSERILLLSGPPGLGKTTLAHVIAETCGYNAFELNASDARNAAAVEDRVRAALESHSMKDPRPTLVIVDEIDGATGGGGGANNESQGFIKSLIKLVESGNGAGAKSKKGKKRGRPLLRPIICICNDLYAPALRPLRPLARLVRLNKPTNQHLVSRLRDVCEAESLKAESRALTLLVELCGADVRSCLNALQMARAKSDTLRVADVRDKDGSGLGIKDGGASIQKVWESLFRTATPKERARGGKPADHKEAIPRLIEEVMTSGEYERILQGCFEHYPNLRSQDDGWWRFSHMHEWVAWGAMLGSKVWELGTHELSAYVPYSFAKWHLLFANTVNDLPSYPRVDYENHLRKTAFEEIADQLHASLSPSLRVQFNKTAVVCELGPSLMRMLSPDIKPVNSQVVRPEERGTLASMVNIMLSLSLELVPDRSEQNQLIYRLEPPIDAFVQYEGKRAADVGPTRMAVRKLVHRELESAKMRRRAAIAAAAASGSKLDGAGELDESMLDQKLLAARAAQGAIAAYKRADEQRNPDGAKAPAKVAVDFFGRPVVKKVPLPSLPPRQSDLPEPLRAKRAAKEVEKSGPLAHPHVRTTSSNEEQGRAKPKVFYNYHEGYSNAVRKPVKMSTLLA